MGDEWKTLISREPLQDLRAGLGSFPCSPHPKGPRTHVPIYQHIKADAKSLQERAVLAAILHLVVFGKPGGQR